MGPMGSQSSPFPCTPLVDILHVCTTNYGQQMHGVIWQDKNYIEPLPLAVGNGDPLTYTVFLGSPLVSTPNRMSIRSAVFARPALMTDRLTDAGIIERSSPLIIYSMRPEMSV